MSVFRINKNDNYTIIIFMILLKILIVKKNCLIMQILVIIIK